MNRPKVAHTWVFAADLMSMGGTRFKLMCAGDLTSIGGRLGLTGMSAGDLMSLGDFISKGDKMSISTICKVYLHVQWRQNIHK